METRKITVVSTKTQTRKTINTAATTLRELKADLVSTNIDFNGMTFYEGVSKTELLNDDTILPHDLPYKGTVTNDLVIMLTNTNKKIKSGYMTRQEAYMVIKRNNLQQECIKRFGKNFTQCSTSNLLAVIEDFNKKETRKDKKNQVPTSAVVSKKELKEMPKTQNQGNLTAAFAYLVAKLVGNNVLENNSIKEMENILGCEFKSINKDFDKVVKEDQSPYSNDEIEDMLGFVEGC